MSKRSTMTELCRGYAEGHRKKEKIAKLAASWYLGLTLWQGLNATEDIKEATHLYVLSRDVDQLADRIIDNEDARQVENLAQRGRDAAKGIALIASVEVIIGTACGALACSRIEKARSERGLERYWVESAKEYKTSIGGLRTREPYVPSGPVVPGERATYGPPLLSQAPPNEGC